MVDDQGNAPDIPVFGSVSIGIVSSPNSSFNSSFSSFSSVFTSSTSFFSASKISPFSTFFTDQLSGFVETLQTLSLFTYPSFPRPFPYRSTYTLSPLPVRSSTHFGQMVGDPAVDIRSVKIWVDHF